MAKYIGSWNINNGEILRWNYKSNNKRQLSNHMRCICKNTMKKGDLGYWEVLLNNGYSDLVISGTVKK